MPVQYFAAGTFSSAIATDVGTLKINKNIGKPGRFDTQFVGSIGQVARIRNITPQPGVFTSTISGSIRRRLRFPVGSMNSTIRGEVRFFLAVSPVAPPEASLKRASLNALSSGFAPAFTGSRIPKGDLVPVSFKVQGQKLEGLFAEFTATRKDDPLAAPIAKSSTIHLTEPVEDEVTRFSTMMGSFAIEPSDTVNFPDTEVELHYKLRLLDGIGRVYTVECGSFTVFNC
jgi:hypothetical protein